MDETKEEARLTKNRNATTTPTTTKSGLGGGNPKCARCGKTVYHNEKAIAAGKDWHLDCLKCKMCKKRLDATILCENNNEVYCNPCYSRNFGIKGVGYGIGGGLTSNDPSGSETVKSSDKLVDPVEPVSPTSQSGTKFCPSCGNLCTGMKFCASCGTKIG